METRLNIVVTPKGVKEVEVVGKSLEDQEKGIALYRFLLPELIKIGQLLQEGEFRKKSSESLQNSVQKNFEGGNL